MKEKTRWSEIILKLHTALVYAFLYIPIIVLVVFSFNSSKRNAVWKGFTLDWYYQLIHNTELLRALENSLKVGI